MSNEEKKEEGLRVRGDKLKRYIFVPIMGLYAGIEGLTSASTESFQKLSRAFEAHCGTDVNLTFVEFTEIKKATSSINKGALTPSIPKNTETAYIYSLIMTVEVLFPKEYKDKVDSLIQGILNAEKEEDKKK